MMTAITRRRSPKHGAWLVTLLVAMVGTGACEAAASPEPSAAELPASVSSAVGSFVHQTDGHFGYAILRPADWAPVALGQARGYAAMTAEGERAGLILTVVNLGVLDGQPDGSIAQLDLFRKTPTLQGWTTGIERLWRSIGLTFTRAGSNADAVIYIVDLPDQVQLVAFAVDRGQPLAIDLTGSSAFADVAFLRQAGVLADFETIVASIEAIPRASNNVDPALD